MIVKCIGDKASQFDSLIRPVGVSANSEFGGISIGMEYLIMGIILGDGYLSYLFDDDGLVLIYPSFLFKISDSTIPPNWHFNDFTTDSFLYPYRQAVLGYYELCFKNGHLEQLIDLNMQAYQIYSNRKEEIKLLNNKLK